MAALDGRELLPASGVKRPATAFADAGVPLLRIAPKPLALVVAAHTILALVLASQPTEAVPLPVEPSIVVALIPPEPVAEAPKPAIQPPRPTPPSPRPVAKRAEPRPQPVRQPVPEPEPPLAAQVPDTVAAPPAPAVTEPTPAPPVTKEPALPAEEPVRPAAEVREVPVEPPRFNADYLDNPAPGYPPLSRRLGEQGRVLLRVQVTAGGTPAQVLLHKSSGHHRLDEVAAETVRRWKFVPARQGDKPVEAWVIVPIQFSLRG